LTEDCSEIDEEEEKRMSDSSERLKQRSAAFLSAVCIPPHCRMMSWYQNGVVRLFDVTKMGGVVEKLGGVVEKLGGVVTNLGGVVK
jgi:hypothetical protein